MKIYQLHKYGGEWEDAYDYIIGSYLYQKRAEEEKIKAEAKEQELVERSNKCYNCPFLENPFSQLDVLTHQYKDYCSDAKLDDGDEWGIICDNCYHHWDESYFEIKEVEVEA